MFYKSRFIKYKQNKLLHKNLYYAECCDEAHCDTRHSWTSVASNWLV